MTLSNSFVKKIGAKVFEFHCYNAIAGYAPWDDATYEQGVINQSTPEGDGSFTAEFIDDSYARWDNTSYIWQEVLESIEIDMEV